jgi:hypothetical protein
VWQPVVLLQDAAHPDIGRRLEIRAAHLLADQILGRANAGCGVDEQEPVTEAPVQEHRNGGERRALGTLHEIGADIGLADVELGAARHAPVALARAHAREHDEIDAVSGHRAFFERAHDLVIPARDREPNLAGHRPLPSPRRARA